MPHELFSPSSLPEKIQPSQQRQPTDPSFSSPIMDSQVHARSAPSHKQRLEADGEPLVELLWQDGSIVAQPTDRRSLGGDPGASGVTGEEAAAAWLIPDGGGGGDLYSQLWHSIAAHADGGAGAFIAGSGEAGSSFCGSNAVTAPALRADDDDAAPPPPPPLEEDEPGASSAGGHALSKRTRDELYSRSEDADCEAVDETRQSRRPAGKRRTRAAEVHNQSERRRRDRINEKMKALQELVPHCNKTDKASILDEAIEYLKSLQLQVQIMWMTTGVAPMMFPGAHQLMPMPMGLNSVCMPAAQGLSQLQIVPPCMNNPLPNQMPQVQPPVTNSPSVANQMSNNGIFEPKTPFLHPPISAAQVPVLFPNGSQSTQQKEIHELLASTANPASGPRPPSSSDGTRT